MSRLINRLSPNPRLQRTRLRSPLSRKPFGVLKPALGVTASAVLAIVAITCRSAPARQDTCSGTTALQQGYSSELIGAAGSGDLPRVKDLLAKGVDVNFQECDDITRADGTSYKVLGWTAVMIASAHGFDDVVKTLVSAGADLNRRSAHGETALRMATEAGRAKTAQLLRQLGARE